MLDQKQTSHKEQLNVQDKENLSSLMEMLGADFEREVVEALYNQNQKNMEKTLDQFLTNQVPKSLGKF